MQSTPVENSLGKETTSVHSNVRVILGLGRTVTMREEPHSLRREIVQGLIDHHISLNSCEIGECIYCGECDAPLRNEHAIPYGLNGPWTLLRASCDACAKITSRFEHEAMRRLWPDVRTALAMQSRRRDKRSMTLPLVVQRDGVQETVQVPRTKFPTYLPTPLFPPPATFWTDRPVRGVFTNLDVLHVCGPTFAEASKEYPGNNFFGMHINFSAEDFARMLAKIGFCAAVATVGLGAFTNTPSETSSSGLTNL